MVPPILVFHLLEAPHVSQENWKNWNSGNNHHLSKNHSHLAF